MNKVQSQPRRLYGVNPDIAEVKLLEKVFTELKIDEVKLSRYRR